MSAVFSHAIRFEIADKNPITPVRQSAKRKRTPVILDAAELRRLFSELGLRERAMIVLEALTGIRRSELMGLKWKDVDFIGGRIEITRSVVDQAIGKCKTEATGGFQATRNTRRRLSADGEQGVLGGVLFSLEWRNLEMSSDRAEDWGDQG